MGNGRGGSVCWDGVRERGMEDDLSPTLKFLLQLSSKFPLIFAALDLSLLNLH